MWIEDLFEVEPGIGVACARDNAIPDLLFKQAQDHLRHDLSLFLLTKDDANIVYAPQCGLLLTSSLDHIESNTKILDAYRAGVPVVLATDVVACSVGESIRAFFAPSCHADYRKDRQEFEQSWQLASHVLAEGDRYFATHTRAGGKLKCIERIEEYLCPVIGDPQDVGNALPKKQLIDFVVVPTLRTISKNFALAINRCPPVPVVRSYELIDKVEGDEVPAWIWNGGDFWTYPRKYNPR